MKRFFVVFLFLCIGCSKTTLSCSCVDYSSFFGVKSVSDVLVFKNNNLVEFNRNVRVTINNDLSGDSVYKYLKSEGKVFKRNMSGKYKINKYNNVVSLDMNSKKIKDDNLFFLSFDSRYIDDIKSSYSSLGFSCE